MIRAFLTAYDPSDLPGGSVDPLGFEQGYLFLADKILPGMTVAASCPRYFSLLCAGAALAGDLQSLPDNKQRAQRQECILRLERLWALANALAFESDDSRLSGLRGITYAARHVALLREKSRDRTDTSFKLLSRQTAYGALGIYGNVAERAKLVYRKTLEVVPSLGEPLAAAFRRETDMPSNVRKAVQDDKQEVGLGELRNWGERAYLWGKAGSEEKRHLRDALQLDPVRTQCCELLRQVPAQNGEPEQKRLRRIAQHIKGRADHSHLWEAMEAIIRYEACYCLALLVLERLLYRCRRAQGGYLTTDDLARDEVLAMASSSLPNAVARWVEHVEKASAGHLRANWSQMKSVHDFLELLATRCGKNQDLAAAVMAHHADVQRGKFDRGRRKMAWLQQVDGRISLSPTRVGGLDFEAKDADDISPHVYRLAAAENWMRAAGLA